MSHLDPQTWYHGLVARWWSLFNVSGPEIGYFRQFVEAGQPALDVACGSGRLLVPYLQAGLDVDDCDVSPDMITLCADAAEAVGVSPNLYCQPMHELDLPRRYRTIHVCGGLGLGSTREQDQQALRRLYEHVEPGGRLGLDNEVPYADATHWRCWPVGQRDGLPEPDRPPGERRRGPDGFDYALQSRMIALDPLGQQERWEVHAYQWGDGSLVAHERHRLTANLYFSGELVVMLERAGFTGVDVRGAYNDLPPTVDDTFLLYLATAGCRHWPCPATNWAAAHAATRKARPARCAKLGQMQTRSGDFELTMDELRAIAGYGLACAQPALILFQRDRPDDPRPADLHPLSKPTQVRHILAPVAHAARAAELARAMTRWSRRTWSPPPPSGPRRSSSTC